MKKQETVKLRDLGESRPLWWLLAWAMLASAIAVLSPQRAAAGTFEVSAGLSFTQSDYGGGNFEWTRKWGASVGYYFFTVTEIEIAFQDITDRTKITGFQDTTFHDQIYSLNLVQSLLPKTFPVQPYIKAGVGQLNRDATGTYAGGAAPPISLDQITIIFGVGLKVYITKYFALRGEATTYLPGGVLSEWQNNFAIESGISFFY